VNGSSALAAALAGFGAGASLIVAIGAQNAYVLRQGLRREHVLTIVVICVLSDVVLIVAGVAGIGALTRTAPVVLQIVRWAGAAFLLGYAALAARRAVRGGAIGPAAASGSAWHTVVLTCLALTWLNPHVYLDTVVVLGTLAAAHGSDGRWFFAVGAMLASLCWFTALGFGSRVLSGVLSRPLAWRIIDSAIAVLMVVLAIALLLG
jgi:L-lysine exporter family protein LysE/ArgO